MPRAITARKPALPKRAQPGPTKAAAAASPAVDWLALDRQLCFALYSASLAMTKLYKPMLDPLGLTYPQYLVMLVLWQADSVTVGQLGERLALDSGTLTPLLKRLEAAGMLQRHRDSADERRVLLQLTASGRALKAQAQKLPAEVIGATGCELSEISQLTTQLQALRQQLQDAHDQRPESRSSPAA
jgi:DNA-binding MarR family transcriptional regulator